MPGSIEKLRPQGVVHNKTWSLSFHIDIYSVRTTTVFHNKPSLNGLYCTKKWSIEEVGL